MTGARLYVPQKDPALDQDNVTDGIVCSPGLFPLASDGWDLMSLKFGNLSINVTEQFSDHLLNADTIIDRSKVTACFNSTRTGTHQTGLRITSGRWENTPEFKMSEISDEQKAELECSCAQNILLSLTTSQQQLRPGLLDLEKLERAQSLTELICSGAGDWIGWLARNDMKQFNRR
ncbi:hypothetical protein M427DRAFT_54107 [Gonapodya prolifera JEL478]|uniref:Uncharacterized protein n=1 Tax=Gonapodya prolifera (strain JEL478) TaxID=1344416 RepID=A0A139AM51_GONPJ|nr:hypothetical protein M427DRAFT_54107 [Gonapodya prolifera JEL478]|eukprot:KXS17856.1 hypothetical protein M427DRAFT_54107 [Gonapodya prolifera JEL478]